MIWAEFNKKIKQLFEYSKEIGLPVKDVHFTSLSPDYRYSVGDPVPKVMDVTLGVTLKISTEVDDEA
jgi:hypothetical protein